MRVAATLLHEVHVTRVAVAHLKLSYALTTGGLVMLHKKELHTYTSLYNQLHVLHCLKRQYLASGAFSGAAVCWIVGCGSAFSLSALPPCKAWRAWKALWRFSSKSFSRASIFSSRLESVKLIFAWSAWVKSLADVFPSLSWELYKIHLTVKPLSCELQKG